MKLSIRFICVFGIVTLRPLFFKFQWLICFSLVPFLNIANYQLFSFKQTQMKTTEKSD